MPRCRTWRGGGRRRPAPRREPGWNCRSVGPRAGAKCRRARRRGGGARSGGVLRSAAAADHLGKAISARRTFRSFGATRTRAQSGRRLTACAIPSGRCPAAEPVPPDRHRLRVELTLDLPRSRPSNGDERARHCAEALCRRHNEARTSTRSRRAPDRSGCRGSSTAARPRGAQGAAPRRLHGGLRSAGSRLRLAHALGSVAAVTASARHAERICLPPALRWNELGPEPSPGSRACGRDIEELAALGRHHTAARPRLPERTFRLQRRRDRRQPRNHGRDCAGDRRAPSVRLVTTR